MIRTFGKRNPMVDRRAFVHDSSEVIGDVVIKAEASIWPLAVLRGDVNKIVVGERTNIQDLTVIHCREKNPTILGRGITVGHNVVLHGARVGDGCLIGMGSVVMEAAIGAQCLVAAGSLVLAGMKFPPRRLIMGRPARVLRPLTAAELRSLKLSEQSYVRLMNRHRAAPARMRSSPYRAVPCDCHRKAPARSRCSPYRAVPCDCHRKASTLYLS